MADAVVRVPSLLTEQAPPVFQIEAARHHSTVRGTSDTPIARADVTRINAMPNDGEYATPIRYNLGLLPLVTTVDLHLPSQREQRQESMRRVTRGGWVAPPIEQATPGLTIGDQTISIGPFMR